MPWPRSYRAWSAASIDRLLTGRVASRYAGRMAETVTTFCRICEALCGLRVTVDGGKIQRIDPDPEHVATDGFACVKGLKQHQLYDSPDRVRFPMKRVGSGVAARLVGAGARRDRRQAARCSASAAPDAIAMYVGTAAGFGILHPIFAQGFMTRHGRARACTRRRPRTARASSRSRATCTAFRFTQPFPDVDRTQCLIIVGANPVISKWSFLQVSNPAQAAQGDRARAAAHVFVVDPRRTETAKVAGEHVFIRPGTDVFFYLAFLHELIATRRRRPRARRALHDQAVDEVERLAEAWPPERTDQVTGIPAATLREHGRRLSRGATAPRSTPRPASTWAGAACSPFWLQEVINAVSGNLDRAGGTLVGRGRHRLPALRQEERHAAPRPTARAIGDFASVNDAFPGRRPRRRDPDARRARRCARSSSTGGNPLITMPNSARLRDALATARAAWSCSTSSGTRPRSLAHYILPCTSPFERADLPFIFPLMLGPAVAALSAGDASASSSADGEQRDEATIYLDLCRAAGVSLFGSARRHSAPARDARRACTASRPSD